VIVGAVWLNCFAWVPVTYLLSSGRTKFIAYVQVAEVIPYVAAAYVLTARFGAMGAALVWAAAIVVDAAVYFVLVWHIAKLPFLPLSQRRLRSIGGPAALGCALGLAAIVSRGLVVRLGLAAGLGAVYVVSAWQLVLTAREREGLLRMVLDMVRRGPPPLHSRRGL
jgi:O-antigen/teichoic acid export membrane protein